MSSEDRFLVNAYYTDKRDPGREVFVGGVGVSPYGNELVYYFRDSGAIASLDIDAFKEYYTPSLPKPGERGSCVRRSPSIPALRSSGLYTPRIATQMSANQPVSSRTPLSMRRSISGSILPSIVF